MHQLPFTVLLNHLFAAPVTAMLEMVSGPAPVLVKVTDLDPLDCPKSTEPKAAKTPATKKSAGTGYSANKRSKRSKGGSAAPGGMMQQGGFPGAGGGAKGGDGT